MRLRSAFAVGFLGLAAWSVLRAQKPFKEWPAIEYVDFALPSDYQEKHEWTRARLRYTDITGYPDRSYYGRAFPGYWTMDFPRSDRHLLAGVRRLTRIDTKSRPPLLRSRAFRLTCATWLHTMSYGIHVNQSPRRLTRSDRSDRKQRWSRSASTRKGNGHPARCRVRRAC